jgi:hypothetical protein
MPALASISEWDTTVGVIAMGLVIVALVVAIAIFIAVQAFEEHADNVGPHPDVRHGP